MHRSYQQHHWRGRISEATQPEEVSCTGSQISNTKALGCLAFKSVTTTAVTIIHSQNSKSLLAPNRDEKSGGF